MKAILVIFNKALTEQIFYILEKLSVKGYTYWETVHGKGEVGEPRMGTHTWPEENSALFMAVTPDMGEQLVNAFRFLDETKPHVGLKVFTWHVEKPF
ncbi:MAG: hypothetical protein N2Z72_01785 [Bacteroidales bacterium]|nr:hypothetical protein [Bacteroidales bacterium]